MTDNDEPLSGEKPDGRNESTPDENDKVGPGRPPKKHRWKKGDPSPNPKGRPRTNHSIDTDMKQFLETALAQKVKVTKENKQVLLTKASMGIEQLVNAFAKGD